MTRTTVPMAPPMTTDRLPVIDCTDPDPRERGRAHGEALRTVIRDKIIRWHMAIAADYGQEPLPFIERLLSETRFGNTIRTWTPWLIPEIEGIAEGAGINRDTAHALQLLDEEWWFGRAVHDGHCSGAALAPAGGHPTVIGQTMDLPAWHDGAQALLRIGGGQDRSSLVFTSAGMIGLMGLSDQGLGLCVNTLASLNNRPDGLPVAFVIRGILAQPDMDAAVQFLSHVPHASGQNYLIGNAERIRNFECSAAGAHELEARGGHILHTNHPLVSTDLAPDAKFSDNSKARLAQLDDHFKNGMANPVHNLQGALEGRQPQANISIPRGDENAATALMTLGAMVCEIGDEPRLFISGGPPTPNTWREVVSS